MYNFSDISDYPPNSSFGNIYFTEIHLTDQQLNLIIGNMKFRLHSDSMKWEL